LDWNGFYGEDDGFVELWDTVERVFVDAFFGEDEVDVITKIHPFDSLLSGAGGCINSIDVDNLFKLLVIKI
jgi:hypothetical protein